MKPLMDVLIVVPKHGGYEAAEMRTLFADALEGACHVDVKSINDPLYASRFDKIIYHPDINPDTNVENMKRISCRLAPQHD